MTKLYILDNDFDQMLSVFGSTAFWFGRTGLSIPERSMRVRVGWAFVGAQAHRAVNQKSASPDDCVACAVTVLCQRFREHALVMDAFDTPDCLGQQFHYARFEYVDLIDVRMRARSVCAEPRSRRGTSICGRVVGWWASCCTSSRVGSPSALKVLAEQQRSRSFSIEIFAGRPYRWWRGPLGQGLTSSGSWAASRCGPQSRPPGSHGASSRAHV